MELLNRDKDVEKAAKALKAMAHPLRLKILCVLKNKEMPIFDITKQVKSSQSNVSQHIDILRDKNIIESRREGNKILCKVKDIKILTLVANMQSTFCSSN